MKIKALPLVVAAAAAALLGAPVARAQDETVTRENCAKICSDAFTRVLSADEKATLVQCRAKQLCPSGQQNTNDKKFNPLIR